jgi:hypothetical protein
MSGEAARVKVDLTFDLWSGVSIDAPAEVALLVDTMRWFTIGTWNVITAGALCAAFRQGVFYGTQGAWSPGCRKPELAYIITVREG